MTDVAISDWRLFGLTVDQIGPFQSMQQFSFLGGYAADEGEDKAAGAPTGPSNLYMLIAPNGKGKTTLLEAIHGLLGLLGSPATGRFAEPYSTGMAQLDVRATWTIDGTTKTVILSIWTGSRDPMSHWPADRLEDEGHATEWAKLGLFMGPGGTVVLSEGGNELGLIFYRAVAEAAGRARGSLFGETLNLPSVLFFPADRLLLTPAGRRTIEEPDNWIYQPAHQFGVDGSQWNGSIENLLAWLAWVDDKDGKEQDRLLRFINDHMFPTGKKQILPIERADLKSYVRTSEGVHGLNALSHGERAMLQLFVRIAAHMSRNTVLLIDEVETHLHSRWMNRMYQGLKELLRTIPSLSIVFTTHSRELIQVFDHNLVEPGIVKGGYLLTDELS